MIMMYNCNIRHLWCADQLLTVYTKKRKQYRRKREIDENKTDCR